MTMAMRIPQIRFTRMASPICVRFKDRSQTPYKRVAVLMDHDEWLENGTRLTDNRVEVTNCREWRAYSFAGLSLVLIWK